MDTLERMAALQAEAERLLRMVAEAREDADFFTHERVHLDLACTRLESVIWALGQTETGNVLGPAFSKEASHA